MYSKARTVACLLAVVLAQSVPAFAAAGENFRQFQEVLARWIADGSAAGHKEDYYDNRDGGHSALQSKYVPGISRVVYAKTEVRSRGWGIQPGVLPHITIGNSSTAGSAGSNGRVCYTSPGLMQILYRQYRGNNLYIYPEHRDHDPGPLARPLTDDERRRKYKPGRGDLFPVNSPYVILSQGSSGSDRPFLAAVALTLGSFQPRVKQRLAETGMLVPAVQMIFRVCNQQVQQPGDYLTGKAHPTVFRGSQLDIGRMMNMAHDMKLDELPPMVQLKVVDEKLPVNGRDYFEPGRTSEVHSDTPCVIARIFRGYQHSRRLVVSAAESFDINERPLKFHWVVLRGDAQRITLTPQNADQSVVELSIPYHDRRPVPGLVTYSYYILPNGELHEQRRPYASKKLLSDKPIATLLPVFNQKPELLHDAASADGQDRSDPDLDRETQLLARDLDQRLKLYRRADGYLRNARGQNEVHLHGEVSHHGWTHAIESNRIDVGVFVHNGVCYSAPGFVTYYMLNRENRTYDSLSRIRAIDYMSERFTDSRLSTPKRWRDEYRWSGDRLASWTRHHASGKTEEYTHDGELILMKGTAGMAATTAPVTYRIVTVGKGKRNRFLMPVVELAPP